MQGGDRSCSRFCGYHNAVGNVFYAVIPYATCNGCVFPGDFLDTLTEVSSHELVEAITDPALNAWWDPNTSNEIGDICNRQTTRLGDFLIQTEWSNSQGACVIRTLSSPPAVGEPFGYAFINSGSGLVEQHNLFRSADGHIHALWFNFTEGWHHEDRSMLLPGVPPAVGDPFGYAFIDSASGLVEQHNLFRSADGHIHALWFNFAKGWHHEDRTMLLPGVPPAVGEPFGYPFVNSGSGLAEQHNLFRSADGHIHALWFNFAKGWHHEDRTTLLPGVSLAIGDPFGYAFINNASGLVEQHNLFRSIDGHIHALWFNFAEGWHHEDRTTLLPGVPPAVGEPFGYAFIDSASGSVEQHNLFRSADGHIHALWFNFAEDWHHEDRTTLLPGVPPAVGDPFGYPFINSASGLVEQHNLFRSADGHIHALWFNFAEGWHHEERGR